MDDEDNDKIKVIEAELNKTKEEYKILQDELNETKEHLKKYTRSWMETQTRPSEFCYKQGLSPVLEKIGKSKTIVVKTTFVEAQLIDLHT
jgi:chromosome segregation ATPase